MRRALVLLLLLARPTAAHAFSLEQGGGTSGVRWAGTLTLFVDGHSRDVAPADAVAAITRAASHWEAVSAAEIEIQSEAQHGEPGYDPKLEDQNKSEVIFVDDGWDYDPMVAATTLVTTDTVTNQIVDADILVNEAQNKLGVLDDHSQAGQGDALDLEAVVTHELGHALGLAHSLDHPEAAMFPATVPGEISKRALASDDVAGIQSLYGAPGTASKHDAAGCTAGVGPDGAASIFAALTLLAGARRRRRARMLTCGFVFAGLAFAVAATAWADAPVRSGRPVPQVEKVVAGQVVRTIASWQGGRIYTDVLVSVERCVSGTCANQESYRVPGGTIGRLRQQLGELQVPAPGDRVQVSLVRARDGQLHPLVRAGRR